MSFVYFLLFNIYLYFWFDFNVLKKHIIKTNVGFCQAAKTGLDILEISTDGQEREAPSGPSQACWTGSPTPSGGREQWTSRRTISYS